MCVCLVCLDLGSFWITEGVQRKARAKELNDGGEADQNLLTALITATHIFECDGDATWSLFPEL